jgi:hypothetical protein
MNEWKAVQSAWRAALMRACEAAEAVSKDFGKEGKDIAMSEIIFEYFRGDLESGTVFSVSERLFFYEKITKKLNKASYDSMMKIAKKLINKREKE